jgi:hypothetical protein
MSHPIIAVSGEAFKFPMVGREKMQHILSDGKTSMTMGFTESAITISAVRSMTA